MRRVEASGTMAATRDFISARLATQEMERREALRLKSSVGVSNTAEKLLLVLSRSSGGSGLAGAWDPRDWLTATRRAQPRLNVVEVVAALRQELADEPIEDGAPHRAEDGLRRLSAIAPQQLQKALLDMLADEDRETQGGLVQCIGRLGAGAAAWAMPVVAAALRSPAARVRGAAIKAIEHWATPEALRLLEGHEEKTPWLADHVRKLLGR